MRVAIMACLAALGLPLWAASASAPFARITLGPLVGYIVPQSYAEDHKAELFLGTPGLVKVEGFWTPTEPNVVAAERVFRETIQSAAKQPGLLFPDLVPTSDAPSSDALDHEGRELALIAQNFGVYLRQYVGIIVDGKKVVFCNYADVPKTDPAAGYIFIQNVFVPDGTVHFLQCCFDPEVKICSDVSIIGSWQKEQGNF